ncbi:MAG: YicC/YloC family endoribonuclease [Pseudomonadota bacterium]
MLHSMTGFARQIAESPMGALTCELRAVNHRYLDVQFRLPDELRAKEPEFRQQVADALKRGKVECGLHYRRAAGSSGELNLNMELVRQIGSSIDTITKTVDNAAPPNSIDVLRWPGVVVEPEVDEEPLYAAAHALIAETVEALKDMRQREGERIAAMLTSRCHDIQAIAASVRERLPAVLDAVRQKQRDRLEKIDVAADPDRLEVELALVAQKLDVDEELDRLDSHIVEILAVIEKDEPVGRRLDFLMQELNREANTLGSKSADAETTRAAVELKVLIEQMREQIQNIE